MNQTSLNYSAVSDEYNRWKLANPKLDISLAQYAQAQDQIDGSPVRKAAYDPSVAQDVNQFINLGISPISELSRAGGEAVGGSLDNLLGTESLRGVVGGIAEDLPRSIGEAALYLTPAGWPVKAAAIADAGLQGYGQSGSVLQGAINAAGLPVGVGLTKKFGELGLKAAGAKELVERVTAAEAGGATSTIAQLLGASPRATTAGTFVGEALGQATGGTLANELQRQASITAENFESGQGLAGTWEQRNPFTVENVVSNVVGNLDVGAALRIRQVADNSPANALRFQFIDRYINARKKATGENFDFAREAGLEGNQQTAELAKTILEQVEAAKAQGFDASGHLNTIARYIGSLKEQQTLKTEADALLAGGYTALSEEQTARLEFLQQRLKQIEADNLWQERFVTASPEMRSQVPDAPPQVRPDEDAAATTDQSVTPFELADPVKQDVLRQTFFDSELARRMDIRDEASFGRFLGGVEQAVGRMRQYYKELTGRELTTDQAMKDMQAKGLLPDITPEWMIQKYSDALASSADGDPNMAQRIMQGKVANELLLQSEAMFQQYVAEKPVWAQREQSFYNRIAKLDRATQQKFLEFQVKLTRGENPFGDGPLRAEGTTMPKAGIVSYVPSWQARVAQVLRNVDPETGLGWYLRGEQKVFVKPEEMLSEKHLPRPTALSRDQGQLSHEERKALGKKKALTDFERTRPSSETTGPDYVPPGEGDTSDPFNRDANAIETHLTGEQARGFTDKLGVAGQDLKRALDQMPEAELQQKLMEVYGYRSTTGKLAMRDPEKKFGVLRDVIAATFYGDKAAGERALKAYGAAGSSLSQFLRNYWQSNIPDVDTAKGRASSVDPKSKLARFVGSLVGEDTVKALTGEGAFKEKRPWEMSQAEFYEWQLDHPEWKYDYKQTRQLAVERGYAEEVADQTQGGTPAADKLLSQGHYLTATLDVSRFVRNRLLRDYGVSPELANRLTEVVAKTAIALRTPGLRFAPFEKSRGQAASYVPGPNEQRTVGASQSYKPATPFDLVRNLAHELLHNMQGAVAGDPFGDRMRAAAEVFEQYAQKLSPQEAKYLVGTINDALVPKTVDDKAGVRRRADYVTKEYPASEEFIGTRAEFLTRFAENIIVSHFSQDGAPTKGVAVPLANVLKHMPEEVSNFMRGFMRDFSMMTDVVADVLENPTLFEADRSVKVKTTDEAKNAAAAFRTLNAELNKVLDMRNIPAASLLAKSLVSALDKGVLDSSQPFVDNRPVGKIDRHYYAPAGAISQAGAYILGQSPREMGMRPGVWTRFLAPFHTALKGMESQGVPLMRETGNILRSLNGAYARLSNQALEPWLTRNVNGKWVFDEANPLFQLFTRKDSQSRAVRSAISKLALWQNENQKLAVDTLPNGMLTITKDGQAAVKAALAGVSPAEHATVLNGLSKLMQSYQTHAKQIVLSQRESAQFHLARLLQVASNLPYDQLMPRAGLVLEGALSGNQQLATQALQGLDPNLINTIGELLGGPDGLVGKLKELESTLASRPYFTTEQRPGRFLVVSKDASGATHTDGANNVDHARRISAELQKQGHTIVDIADKYDRDSRFFDSPAGVLEKYIELEQVAWERAKQRMIGLFGPQAASKLNYSPGAEIMKELQGQGMKSFLAQQKLRPGRERLDALEAFTDYHQRLVGSITKRSVRNQMALLLNDPRLEFATTARNMIESQMKMVMERQPDSVGTIQNAISAYYLGANFSSAALEMTQGLTTLVPLLLRQGKKSLVGAYSALGSAVSKWADLDMMKHGSEVTKLQNSAKAKYAAGVTPTKEETVAYMYRRALDDGILERGALEDINFDRDRSVVLRKRFGAGQFDNLDRISLVKNKIYWTSQIAMWLYSKTSNANNKIAFLAGLEQGMEQGLQGDALFDFAARTKDLSMFGGGKVGRPGYIAQLGGDSKIMRPAFAVMGTLQNYGLGMTTLLMEHGKDWLAKTRKLSPPERVAARKAFATALATQVALGGALGLPFAAAALTAMNKLFGVNAEELAREGLASLAGDDEELGRLLSDVTMSGGLNHLTGLDLSSRLGVGTLLGTSGYQGFAVKDLLGPAPSIVENMFNAVSATAQGDIPQALNELVPQALKNSFEMARSWATHGDVGFRDQSNNLVYRPSPLEAVAYATGFRPNALRERRTAQRLMRQSDEQYTAKRDRDLDRIAIAVLQGDQRPAQEYLASKQTDSAFDPQDFMRSVAKRAQQMQYEKDLLASGASGNDEARRGIYNLFGPESLGRQSEVQRLDATSQVLAQLGGPAYGVAMPGAEDYMKAQMVDQMISQGFTRPEALRYVDDLYQAANGGSSGGAGYPR